MQCSTGEEDDLLPLIVLLPFDDARLAPCGVQLVQGMPNNAINVAEPDLMATL
jgi:hypothetical protein